MQSLCYRAGQRTKDKLTRHPASKLPLAPSASTKPLVSFRGHDEAGRTEHTVGQPGAATYLLSQPDPIGGPLPELQLPTEM